MAVASTSHDLRDIVHSYLRNRLPREMHPSFVTIDASSEQNAGSTLPPYSPVEQKPDPSGNRAEDDDPKEDQVALCGLLGTLQRWIDS